jgi:hypothetical protein
VQASIPDQSRVGCRRVSVAPLREYLLVSAQDHDVNACPVALLDSSRMLRQWGVANRGRRGPSVRKEEPLPKSAAGVPGRVPHPRRHRFWAQACSSRAKLPISYRNHRRPLPGFGPASQSPARARPSASCGITIALVEFMSQSSPGPWRFPRASSADAHLHPAALLAKESSSTGDG